MSKIELNTNISDYGWSQINNNFQEIEDEFNKKVLYRDNPVGEPNSLSSTLDANGQDIINVHDLRVDNEFYLRNQTINQAIDAAAGNVSADAIAAKDQAVAAAALSAGSAANAATSEANAAASYDSFDDRYLGAKASPPTTDNDGNPLLTGALYWDTTLSPGASYPATDITFAPSGNIGSTTVQAALQELDAEKALLAGSGSQAFAASTLTATNVTATGVITPSQTGGIVGTTTNNNANAGSVGEFQSATGVSTGISTLVATNLTTLSLTAGDWDVEAVVNYAPGGGTTVTFMCASVSLTSGALSGFPNSNIINGLSFNNGLGSVTLGSPTVRVSIASTTTVYCIADAAFSGGTLNATGYLRARRIR